MTQIPVDGTWPSPPLSPFDIEIAAALLNESSFNSARITEQPFPRGGYFRTIWECLDGRFVTYLHSWATGTGYLMFARAYVDKFQQPLPSWAVRMPPAVCLRLCKIALSADLLLPATCPQAENGEAMFLQFSALVDDAKLFRSA